MYGVINRTFTEKREKKAGYTAYTYMIEHDKGFKNARHFICGLDDGAKIVDEVIDVCIDKLLENDYDIVKATNMEVGAVKSIDSYIKSMLIYSYKKVREERLSLKRKHGITQQSLYSPIHSSEKDGSEVHVEDYIASADVVDVVVDLKTTVQKLLRVDNTICNGMLILTLLQECGADEKGKVLSILGLEAPQKRDIVNEDVYDLVQDLSKYTLTELIAELRVQRADASALESIIEIIS